MLIGPYLDWVETQTNQNWVQNLLLSFTNLKYSNWILSTKTASGKIKTQDTSSYYNFNIDFLPYKKLLSAIVDFGTFFLIFHF